MIASDPPLELIFKNYHFIQLHGL